MQHCEKGEQGVYRTLPLIPSISGAFLIPSLTYHWRLIVYMMLWHETLSTLLSNYDGNLFLVGTYPSHFFTSNQSRWVSLMTRKTFPVVSSQKKWKKQHFWDWLGRGGGWPFFTFFFVKKQLEMFTWSSGRLIWTDWRWKRGIIWEKNDQKNRKIKESPFF